MRNIFSNARINGFRSDEERAFYEKERKNIARHAKGSMKKFMMNELFPASTHMLVRKNHGNPYPIATPNEETLVYIIGAPEENKNSIRRIREIFEAKLKRT